MNEQSAAAHTNRLAGSTSPYLLQHAHNPVDWYPWGEEALRRAREEDKPILLSIGYSACHWCHVMERESFENEDIAALMNAYFVSIKVDREERPDLDEIYMAATQAMNQGQGGWPMTVFLTPDLHPFFAGTYFPPEDRHGRPGFPTVLGRIAELWQTQRDRVRGQAAEIVEFLRRSVARTPGASLGEEALRQALADFAREYDERHGGFGAAPKFPPAASLMLLLRLHRRLGDGHALEMARKTLDEMARGGMYDQVGGGFHRYSVDEQWLVPHFEKMLYDNALLARAYLEGHQATGDPFHARIAAEILDYVLREMTSPEGGFYSATDADSEGEEGRFFVWTPEQVEEALGDPEAARVFCAYYDITARGNWEGTSIPNTSRTGPAVAGSLGLAPEELERRIATLRAQVYAARKRRVAPGLDDKVLASWNALMIGALAEGHRVLGDPRYLEAAERAARFVLGALRSPEGRLLRTWRAGRAHLGAYLEDYAFLCEALVDLYEAGAAASFLREAERLAAQMLRFFADPAGGFFSTASDHETLIVRHREGNDGAIPGANAAAARALARLSFHFGRDDLREEAARALQAWGRSIERHPRAFSWSLIALDLLLDGPVELAFVGPRGAALDALRREVARHYLPNRIAGHHDPAEGPSDLPLLAGKQAVDGRPALYVCRGFTCQRPVTDPAGVAQALGTAEERPRRASLAGEPSAGSATPEGTSAYVARQPAAVRAYGYRDFGKTGLRASIVGFGGYRVDESEGGHAEALRKALLSGCNLVDTSTNYMDGSSERLIGQVLADLRREGALAREEVVVVSKIGYVQGHNLEAAEERERQGRPYPDMVKHGEGLWHCIHPEFLADQLSLSLERLGLETLDVCLLHNPEYYLIDAHERSHGTLEKRREEFYRRLAESFEYLEAEVESGRIRCYGVSSNTVAARAGEPEATSLPDMLRVAQAAGGDGNHFRVLQLPLNLFEPAGVLERDAAAGGEPSVLALAAERNLAILVNRPLNAVAGAGMLRLADVEVPDAPDLEPQARVVAAHEAAFRRDIGSKLRAAEGSVPPDRLFRWADDLRGVSAHIQGLEHWEQLEGQRILPRLAEVLQALDRSLDGEVGETWRAWRGGYLPELQGLLAACRRLAAERSRQTNGEIRGALSPLLPEDRRSETLSRQAIWVAASTPGVTTVLVGMRRPQYVEDALKVMEWPPAADVTALYTAVRTQATD